jgi:hypothetical protein
MRAFGLATVCLLILMSFLTFRTSRIEKEIEKEESALESVIVQEPNRFPAPRANSAAEAHAVSMEEARAAYRAKREGQDWTNMWIKVES